MKLRRLLIQLAEITVLLTVFSCATQADVGLLLNGALNVGASKWTGAGHSAVYLSGVCMDTPVKLRPCEPGENGVVLTNYRNFGEAHPYEWNAIPLNIYMYGVENLEDRPLYASPTIRWMLQERYREKYLQTLCAGSCATNPHAFWRDTVAATFLRDIYMFTARTTPEQDRILIEKLNREGNVRRYRVLTYNCADFARDVVNTYFPGAARADHLNDFWITSPKAIAKSFAHYGAKHPELGFHVVRFSQVPGEYAPSRGNRKGTEELCRANKWRLPLAVLAPPVLAFSAGSYMISGRFNPEHELQRRPTAEVISLQAAQQEALARGDQQQQAAFDQKIRAARAGSLGTAEEWSGYNSSIRQYGNEAVQQGFASDQASLQNLMQHLVATSWITMDEHGGLWLSPRDGHSHPKVGLSASTLAQDASDARTGYLLAISRVDAELRKAPKNRETLTFFRKDWQLLEQLRGRVVEPLAATQSSSSEQTHGTAQ
jgi:hypothetical protein